MNTNHFRAILLAAPLLFVSAHPLLPKATNINKDFLIDANKPFVYVKFDHIGPGAPRTDDEPASRIWLRLANNCRMPIVVRANGVPDESPEDEVGLEYDVVPNRPVYMVSFSRYSRPRLLQRTSQGAVARQKESEPKTPKIPRGYMEEVASTISIDPGEEILFSMPVNHLGKRWHVEIPFEFDLPAGKGPRDPKTGGEPVMVVEYTLWDLPPESQAGIPTK